MEFQTKLFGNISIEDNKIITFYKGIIGFPELMKFTLITDEELKNTSGVQWLQSLDEPAFSLPVIDPLLVKANYNISASYQDIMDTIGDLKPHNFLILTTLHIPSNIKEISTNLQAPIIINTINNKAVQIILENEDYPLKYKFYK